MVNTFILSANTTIRGDWQVDQPRIGSSLQDKHEVPPIPAQQVMIQQWEAIEIDIDAPSVAMISASDMEDR